MRAARMASARVLICCSPNMSFRRSAFPGNFRKFLEISGGRRSAVGGRLRSEVGLPPPEVKFPRKFLDIWFLSRGQISKRISRKMGLSQRGGCRYPRWAAVLRPRLRGHERRVPRGPRPFTTHVTLSHPTYPPRLSRNRVGFLMHNLILSHEFAAGGRRPPCPVAQSVSQLIRGPSLCTTATAPYPLHTSPTPLPAHPVFTRLAWLGGRRARDDPP